MADTKKVLDLIKKHEKTRKDKEDDRTRHILELNAHAEPVFIAYPDVQSINDLAESDMNDRPLFHFIAKDGVYNLPERLLQVSKDLPDGSARSVTFACISA